jgi:hypothetical protein
MRPGRQWGSWPCDLARTKDPNRQTIAEAGAYRSLEMALRDLEAAARILGTSRLALTT